jgi:selenocysteine lyase/cysteine desulfurase
MKKPIYNALQSYIDADFARFCMPGHKGLMGPQGTGILICTGGNTVPLMSGGTGSDSQNPLMPDFLPDRLEAGTQNVHGIAGLAEGLGFIIKRGTDSILEHERAVIMRAVNELKMLPMVNVFQSENMFCQTGVLSVSLREGSCEEIADRLAQRGICVRAGMHCAPLAHKSAGTQQRGTIRISASVFNRVRDADRFAAGLRDALRK